MKERGIILRDDAVRAVIAGTKTQHRVPVKPQPHPRHGIQPMHGVSPDGFAFGDRSLWREVGADYPDGDDDDRRSPFGVPGDQLWVREAHAPYYFDDGSTGYRADYNASQIGDVVPEPKWTPSAQMRRRNSRLTLRVTDVRVERLRDITEADALAEGIVQSERTGGFLPGNCMAPELAFWELWEQAYGRESRDANPWVWAVAFEVVK